MMLPNYGSSRPVDEVSLWPIRLWPSAARGEQHDLVTQPTS
jgi:hypothetical protein